MTAFLSELVSYVLKFAILFACSAAGIYFGVGRAKAKNERIIRSYMIKRRSFSCMRIQAHAAKKP